MPEGDGFHRGGLNMKKSALLEEKHHAGGAEDQHSGQKDREGYFLLAGPGFDAHDIPPVCLTSIVFFRQEALVYLFPQIHQRLEVPGWANVERRASVFSP